jgi:DnaJ-class molecular chaperone
MAPRFGKVIAGIFDPLRNAEPGNPERFRLYCLRECIECGGFGKVAGAKSHVSASVRCPDCRGEGRDRVLIATCATPEAVGVAIVTLAREGEFEECPLGLLDSEPECETCGGSGVMGEPFNINVCETCSGSGTKPTGTWLITPWLPSARNVTDAARTLAKSKRSVS